MKTHKFSQQQIDDWIEYEAVRTNGAWNMLDPRAREATGLSRERYMFALKNYSELKAFVEGRSER